MDPMILAHQEALESNVDKYHQFLSDFKRTKKVFYGFIEGIDDKSYYYALFKRIIPSDWDILLYDAGCKKNVLRIYKEFDWSEYDKNRILFFIDRDLDDLLAKNTAKGKNIYITDGYSIENSLIEKQTFRLLFECNCKIHNANHIEYDRIADMFSFEMKRFVEALHPIMKWIIYNRFRKIKSNYKNIKMKEIFKFSNGRLLVRKRPKSHRNLYDYIRKTCGGKFNYKDVDGMVFLNNYTNSLKTVRGKFLSWFMVSFFKHIADNSSKYFHGIDSSVSQRASISQENIVELAVVYIDTPKSFVRFLKNTSMRCIQNFEKTAASA